MSNIRLGTDKLLTPAMRFSSLLNASLLARLCSFTLSACKASEKIITLRVCFLRLKLFKYFLSSLYFFFSNKLPRFFLYVVLIYKKKLTIYHSFVQGNNFNT